MRLVDRLIRRQGIGGYWEGMASGAAVLTTTYGSPDHEAVLPQITQWALTANASNGVVFAAIVARLSLFAEVQFQYQRKSDKTLFGNTSLQILEHPWPNGTTGELLARMEQDDCLVGNAYTWAPPGENRLVRLRPDWTTIVSELVEVAGGGTYRQVLGYWWEPPRSAWGQGAPMFVPAQEVAHWAPTPDPEATFRGMSWLTPIYRDIQGDSGLGTYKVRYLENAASPNLLLRYSQKLADPTVDRLKNRMVALYGGADNAFKTLILDQGADATVIGNNMQQMDFANIQVAGIMRILGAAGVPGLVVGLEAFSGVGRSYQEVIRRFGDLTMRPLWRSACACLEQLAPPPGNGARLWYDTSQIAALQDGEQVKAQVTLIRSQSLLALDQAGYTPESAVTAVNSGDLSGLEPKPLLPAPPPGGVMPVQHLLPQPGQPGATADPLPPTLPRLNGGSTSPGDGGNSTRPTPRPASVRRALNGSGNQPGDREGMVSLDLPPGSLPDGSPYGGVHHITVAYLGADVDDQQMADARNAAIAAAQSMPPVYAAIHGVGAFPPGENGRPVYRHVVGPGINALHQRLAHLEPADAASRQTGFKPHVTIAYQAENEPLPEPLPETPVSFDHLSLHRGSHVETIPFGQGIAPSAAMITSSGAGTRYPDQAP